MNCLAKMGVSCRVQVIVPTVHRSMLMKELHETHPMKSLARNYVWRPSMDIDPETMVKHCHSCRLNQRAPAQPTLHPWE